jgi:Mg-chelatase subunit ChlD
MPCLTRGLVVMVLAATFAACTIEFRDGEDAGTRRDRRLDEQLEPAQLVEVRDGLAAAILIDVSGSMRDRVRGESGDREPKIEIARRAARDLVEQFARYAEEHPEQPVLLGVYEFSERSRQPDCRPVVPMGRPDRVLAAQALEALHPEGGTPIGNAMIFAKQELDATGLSRRHLLVVTDGENTDGYAPHRVAAAIARRPDAEQPSIYFVAFDIDANRFRRVRDAGAIVMGAADGQELNKTLDVLLRGEILVER